MRGRRASYILCAKLWKSYRGWLFQIHTIWSGKKILEQEFVNVNLILADDKTVWRELNQKFDRITATEVVQYFTSEQLEDFIINASGHLNKSGKIVLFDIIDPKLYYLWKIGWFSQDFISWNIFVRAYAGCTRRIFAFLKNQPGDITGHSHSPHLIKKLLFETVFRWSMWVLCIMSTGTMPYYQKRPEVLWVFD